MIRAILILGSIFWLFPVVAMAVTALMTDKLHVFVAISALALASILSSAAGAAYAALRGEDMFEPMVWGAFVGMMLASWPIGHYIL